MTKATPAGTLTYTYDPAGNVSTVRSSNTNGTSVDYGWDDANRLEGAAKSATEPRQEVIGRIQQTIWAAFVTYRHEETVRIISVRRSGET